MRILLIILVEVLFLTVSFGQQISISVETDKQEYLSGEDVEIFVRAQNITSDTVKLEFQTGCQSSYSVGSFIPNPFCSQVLTSRTILPDSSYTWSHTHRSSEYLIVDGTHNIIGEVIGYGTSLPISIITDVNESEIFNTPESFVLSQNYPNPFNPITKFQYSIPYPSFVTLKIFNLLGEEIETLISKKHTAGQYVILWNPLGLSSNVYFYQIRAGGFIATKKLSLLK